MILPELGVAVQLKLAPATCDRRAMLVDVPLQSSENIGSLDTSGIGLTVTTKMESGPSHPLAVGVMVYVTVSMVYPVLVSVWLIRFPVPSLNPARSRELGVAVQAKVVPATSAVRLREAVSPEQNS